jgi:AraC family transcriptional regulator, transcriptional activator of pobA
MIKSIDLSDISATNTKNKIDVFPFSICDIKHQEIPTHRHNFYEIIFVENGDKSQIIDQEKYEISDNQIFLLSPYNIHNIDQAHITKGAVVAFDESVLYKTEEDYLLLQKIILEFSINQKFVLSESFSLKLRNYIVLLENEIKGNSQSFEIIYSLLKIILILIQNQAIIKQSVNQSSSENSIFYSFISLVNKHYKKEHSVEFYASLLCLSSLQLNKISHTAIDKTPLTIINERIIQEAKRLFIHTNNKSKTIAYELGFENEAYFSRFFKKNTGINPSNFKRSFV